MMPLASFGQTSAYQLSKVKGFWNDFKIGTIGAGYFPSYTVRVVEDKDEYELDMNNDFNTTAKMFTVRLTPSAFPDQRTQQNKIRPDCDCAGLTPWGSFMIPQSNSTPERMLLVFLLRER